MQTLTMIGLVLDGVGALFIAVTELWRPSPLTRDETINRLETGRSTFFGETELTPEDDGFNELVEALSPHVETHGPVTEIVQVDEMDGRGSMVEVRYETDGDSTYAHDGQVSPALIERWVEKRIGELRRQARAQALVIGGGLLFTGFALQLLATLL